jgi:ABC-type polysaccharide/polyol phosphate export permease
VLDVSTDGVPYVSFAWAGLVPWTFASAVMLITAQSLLNAMPVAGKVYFPREVVPLAQVCAFAIDLLIGTAILIVIVVVQGIGVSGYLVGLVPIFVVLVVWVAAAATMVASLTVFLRDLRYVVPLATQLVFIGTPIMYSASLFPHDVAWINSVNPVAVVVTATRAVTIEQTWPDWSTLLLQGAAAVAAFVAVLAYVRSVEPRMIDIA